MTLKNQKCPLESTQIKQIKKLAVMTIWTLAGRPPRHPEKSRWLRSTGQSTASNIKKLFLNCRSTAPSRPIQTESKGLSVGRLQGLTVDRSVDRQRAQMCTPLAKRPGRPGSRPFWPVIDNGRPSGRLVRPEIVLKQIFEL